VLMNTVRWLYDAHEFKISLQKGNFIYDAPRGRRPRRQAILSLAGGQLASRARTLQLCRHT
jgi:hypothetical protein